MSSPNSRRSSRRSSRRGSRDSSNSQDPPSSMGSISSPMTGLLGSEPESAAPSASLGLDNNSIPAAGHSESQSQGASIDLGGAAPTTSQPSEQSQELSGTNPSAPNAPDTPFRPDLGSHRQTRLVPASSRPSEPGSPRSAMGPESQGDLGRTVIWGTNINVAETMTRFTAFLNEYTEADADHPMYPALLADLAQLDAANFNLDCTKLRAHDARLYTQLVRYPQEVVPIFDMVIHDELCKVSPDFAARFEGPAGASAKRVQVRPFALDEVTAARALNPTDIDQLIAVRGMVIRATSVIPDIKRAYFTCLTCAHAMHAHIDRGRIAEPTSCERCDTPNSMRLIHNRCTFSDKQLIKLQEAPEAVPDGETPQTLTLAAFDELVDLAKPGDRVEITGIYRAQPVRVNPRQRNVKAVYRTYVDVVHIKKTDKRRLSAEDPSAPPESEFFTPFNEGDAVASDEDAKVTEIKALAADPAIYDKLTRSLAPSIWELDDIKKGLLCQLFGGTDKPLANGQRIRGEINVLLCGDPGTSKSQLLQYVHKIAPRGIYTSGKGSSAVGLTAYVTKDPDTRELVLESGALVLSDRGVCAIDEFDKMSDQTRSVLHEAMEQQTVSIAKAGIITTLNARTSILASANPQESRYNPHLSVVDNIQLPPTLLSRFDLIYLVLDNPNEATDRALANHLIGLYYENPRMAAAELSQETLSAYISYAKRHIHPQISREAVEDLVNGYVRMRRAGNGAAGKTVSATPRQLESLIRLSEAHARMRLSQSVDRQDVTEAIRLMEVALQRAATDPLTGRVDMQQIYTGRSAVARTRHDAIQHDLEELFAESNTSVFKTRTLLEAVTRKREAPIGQDELLEVLRDLANEEVITLTADGTTVRKLR